MKAEAISGAGAHSMHVGGPPEPQCIEEARAKLEDDLKLELRRAFTHGPGGRFEIIREFKKSLAELEGKVASGTCPLGDGASDEPSVKNSKEFKSLDGDALISLFREDPDAFMKFMGDLKDHERQAMTMRLQDQMQSQNQLFSLMSNLQQAEHQTSKSVISNIRV